MGHLSHRARQRFPYSSRDTFQALRHALAETGLRIVSADRELGRIAASAPARLFSWGQHLTIAVEPLGTYDSQVCVESHLKWALDAAGSHYHQQNIEKVLSAASAWLRRHARDIPEVLPADDPPEVLPADE